MLAVRGREVTMARHPNPAKIEPVVTSKCTSGRPLLTGTALQTEFVLTHSKQMPNKFLTGARTHIRIFNFSPFPTQNPAQLIQRLHALIRRKKVHSRYPTSVNSLLSRRFTRASLRSNTRPVSGNRRRNAYQIPKTVPPENSTGVSPFLIPKTVSPENSTGVTSFLSRLPAVAGCLTRASLRSVARPTADHRRRNPYQIPKTVPPENSTGVSLFLSRCFTRASFRFHPRPAPKSVPFAALLPGSAQNIENDVTSTKQTTEDFLPGATTTPSLSRDNAPFTIKIPVEPAAAQMTLIHGRRGL